MSAGFPPCHQDAQVMVDTKCSRRVDGTEVLVQLAARADRPERRGREPGPAGRCRRTAWAKSLCRGGDAVCSRIRRCRARFAGRCRAGRNATRGDEAKGKPSTASGDGGLMIIGGLRSYEGQDGLLRGRGAGGFAGAGRTRGARSALIPATA